MIEQYFIAGLQFNWTPPQSVSPPNMVGPIAQSANGAPLLSYAGMDGEVLYGAMQTPAALGLNAGFNIPYVLQAAVLQALQRYARILIGYGLISPANLARASDVD